MKVRRRLKPFILPQSFTAMEINKLLVLTLAIGLSVGLFATTFRTGTAFAASQCQTVNGVQQCEGGSGSSSGPGGGGDMCSSTSTTVTCSGGGGGFDSHTGTFGGLGAHSTCVDGVCTTVGSPSVRSP
jgi:hypothetical protein